MLRPQTCAHCYLYVTFVLSSILVFEVSRAELVGYWHRYAQREQLSWQFLRIFLLHSRTSARVVGSLGACLSPVGCWRVAASGTGTEPGSPTFSFLSSTEQSQVVEDLRIIIRSIVR